MNHYIDKYDQNVNNFQKIGLPLSSDEKTK